MNRLIPLLISTAIIVACPYYNTFYNAKRAFSEAEKLRKDALKQGITQVPQQAQLLYERAIENSALLMRDHPHSDLIDDALVLIGDAFEIQGEYPKAIRKYEEVLTNYPDSKWYPYCAYALGKTALSAGDTLRAEESLRNFLVQYPASEWAPDSHMLLGSVDIARQDYAAAIGDLNDFLTSFPKDKRRPEAEFFIAQSHLEMNRTREALELFGRVGKTARTMELEFEARYMVGECLRRDSQYEQALAAFEELVRKSEYIRFRPKTMLAIASCKASLDREDDAIADYELIRERYERERTYDAEVSEALFEIGRINEQRGDLEKADELYGEAGKRSPRAFWVSDAANGKTEGIRLLTRYRGDLSLAISEMSSSQPDSSTDNSDPTAVDSLANARIVSARFKLAEVYLFQFGLIDSALEQYSLAELEAGGGDLAAKAAYSQAWIHENVVNDTSSSRSGYENVISQYDTTVYASASARALKRPDPRGFTDAELFARAEAYLFDSQEPDSATVIYRRIVDRFPDGSYAPRSLYALGWVAETHDQDSAAALRYYREIKASFPRSDASAAANLKVKYLEEMLSETTASDSTVVPDEDINPYLLSIGRDNRHGVVTEVIRDRVVIALNQGVGATRGDKGYLFAMDDSDSVSQAVRVASMRILDAVIPDGPRRGISSSVNPNLYSGMGDKIIATLPPGKTFDVLSEQNDWVQIRVDGQEGFVDRQFVSLDSLILPTATAVIEKRFPAWAPDEWLGAVILGIDSEPDSSTGRGLVETATPSVTEVSDTNSVTVEPHGLVLNMQGDQMVVKLDRPMDLKVGGAGTLYAISSDGTGVEIGVLRIAQIRLPDLGMANVTTETQLYANPGVEPLLTMPPGIAVVVLAEEREWFKVRVGESEGYLADRDLKMIPPAVPFQGTVTASGVNLHKSPSGEVNGQLAKNESLRVVGLEGGWFQVEAEGGTAYVNSVSVMPDALSEQLIYCTLGPDSETVPSGLALGAIFNQE